jgi:hypothetical protein
VKQGTNVIHKQVTGKRKRESIEALFIFIQLRGYPLRTSAVWRTVAMRGGEDTNVNFVIRAMFKMRTGGGWQGGSKDFDFFVDVLNEWPKTISPCARGFASKLEPGDE